MKKINFLFLLLATATSVTAQKNLIQNGGFENDLLFWQGDAATLSPYDYHSGKKSCIITQFVGQEWKGIDQIVAVPKNAVAIEFSGWIKSEAIEKGTNNWNTGKFDVEFLNAGQKNISNESIASLLGTTPWTFYKKTILLPEKCSKFRVMLALGQTNGTILFDEIKATALTQEDYNKITAAENAARLPQVITDSDVDKIITFSNGSFEEGSKHWRGAFESSNSVVKEGNNACKLSATDFVWTGIDQSAEIPANSQFITVSGWLKSENIQQGKDPWNNGLLNIEFTADGQTKTGDDQSVTFVSGTTDWTFYTKTFAIPKNTRQYRVMIALGFATGTLYADQISVDFK